MKIFCVSWGAKNLLIDIYICCGNLFDNCGQVWGRERLRAYAQDARASSDKQQAMIFII